jgi:DNA (cytosine-5)-methyltransferase 1
MQIVDLYSGIGGFSLAGNWMNWKTVLFCELDEFCQKVLSYHFPGIPIHDDIKTLTVETLKKSKWNPSETTIVVGGFP